jgi:OOP family OmpA-OmpF porin
MGDINFSNLLRRVDNHSPYRWAFHGYGYWTSGIQNSLHDNNETDGVIIRKGFLHLLNSLDINSIYYQVGLGLKYNVSKLIDIEARTMYIISGDDDLTVVVQLTQPITCLITEDLIMHGL